MTEKLEKGTKVCALLYASAYAFERMLDIWGKLEQPDVSILTKHLSLHLHYEPLGANSVRFLTIGIIKDHHLSKNRYLPIQFKNWNPSIQPERRYLVDWITIRPVNLTGLPNEIYFNINRLISWYPISCLFAPADTEEDIAIHILGPMSKHVCR